MAASQEYFPLILNEIKVEACILKKIIYKGANQHRNMKYMQAMHKAQRSLNLALTFGVPQSPTRREETSGGSSLQKLMGSSMSLHQAILDAQNGASAVTILLSMSYFMPFALCVLACLARLHLLLVKLLENTVKAYNECAASLQRLQGGRSDAEALLPLRMALKWKDNLPHIEFEGLVGTQREQGTEQGSVRPTVSGGGKKKGKPLQDHVSSTSQVRTGGRGVVPSPTQQEGQGKRKTTVGGSDGGSQNRQGKKAKKSKDFFNLLTNF